MLLFVQGEALYGKVDVIPGVGHVATVFYHAMFVPLIPKATYCVAPDTGSGVLEDRYLGTPMPLDKRSVAMGYAEGVCLALLVAGVVIAIERYLQGATTGLLVGLGLLVVGGFLLFGLRTVFCKVASYERASEVAKRIGMRSEHLIALELAYGKIDESEAHAQLDALQAKVAAKKAERSVAQAERRAAKKAQKQTKQDPKLRAKAPKRSRRRE